ncbi:S4 domain containing protein [Tritrichomonas foetus]|uniref:S4 domain containing protein n=1 Tax=Tritrichomonas foetus TaxID=1144522 RepID=A0A1J4JK90_9EUKA|nr:S4 domain containing protein [Tritrichomonas foetus]|eukprot:OHS97955.1 S4 domain containing protein [Tritrichomonas foetus]
MGRKLKYHEQKLLKKTNLFQWKKENNVRIGEIMARYCLQSSEEYHNYNRLVGKIQQFANFLRQMDPDDKVRITLTKQFVDRIYNLGIIESPVLSECENITVAAVCRRRLPVVLKKLRFCEKVTEADKYVRQGHVKIGPDVVTDPATLVTKEMEDFIGWTHGSKIKEHVDKFNENYDTFDHLD